MNATKEFDTAERLAHEVEEISKLEAMLDENPEAQRSLAGLRVRLIDLQPTVRLSVAADLLEISLPTIRAWMESGPLREAEGSSPRRVSLKSVLEVRPVLRDLRELGQDRNLLAALSARLEDERSLADPELQRSVEEMRRGELIDVTRSRRRESPS